MKSVNGVNITTLFIFALYLQKSVLFLITFPSPHECIERLQHPIDVHLPTFIIRYSKFSSFHSSSKTSSTLPPLQKSYVKFNDICRCRSTPIDEELRHRIPSKLNDSLEALIGIECHIQLNTKSKAFCSCSTTYSPHSPNTHICNICVGEPGALPSLNRQAVKIATRVAAALHCTIDREVHFDRKVYFYSDTPKNYQITQSRRPLGRDGYLLLPNDELMYIRCVQLEEDSAKVVYENDSMLIDFNRAGVPLVEIVTKPRKMKTNQIILFAEEVVKLIRFIEASTCKLEEGGLRCDINVSIDRGRSGGQDKVEIKNINSFKHMKLAADYEIARQSKLLEAASSTSTNAMHSSTRYWDHKNRCTRPLRVKEGRSEYLYIEEPDIPVVELSKKIIDDAHSVLLETPNEAKQAMMMQYNLSSEDATLLAADPYILNYFKEVVSYGVSSNEAAKWIINEVLKESSKLLPNKRIDETPLLPSKLSELIELIQQNVISHQIAKTLIPSLLTNWTSSVFDLVETKKMKLIDNTSEIETAVSKVLNEYPQQQLLYRAGKQQLLNFFVGKVMGRLKYKANPVNTRYLMEAALQRNASINTHIS